MKRTLLSLALAFAATAALSAQNPYLPLWEYIPDGEPHVFEDPDRPGKYRVYIYGSHDVAVTMYCGRDQVVWSAPVEDPTSWRYDGIIFKSVYDRDGHLLDKDGLADVLYAPDVAMKVNAQGKKEYFLYPNNQGGGRNSMVAKSDRPDGPFHVINWSKEQPWKTDGVLAFDPAVFVDDDGRVYGYWGYEGCNMAELDPETMATVKPGTKIISDFLTNSKENGQDRFFEASSMRKVGDKYVFVYSRTTLEGELGLPACNYSLAYAYGDSPLGPFTYGGTIIDARAPEVVDGKTIITANPYGNTHGSICEINGKWWVFYHRQTGTDEYSRQSMVAPIEIKVEPGKGGKVYISQAEYTSEGFRTEGLNPLDKSAAGWACYYTNPEFVKQEYPNFLFTGSYIKATRADFDSYIGPFNQKIPLCPVVNNTAGSTVGYKYFNFDHTAGAKGIDLVAHIKPEGVEGTVSVFVGGPEKKRGGVKVGEFRLSKDAAHDITAMTIPVDGVSAFRGKQPLFFVFESAVKGASMCELYDFQFVKR